MNELRYAVSTQRRSPGFTAAAAYMSARETMRVDPVTALPHD